MRKIWIIVLLSCKRALVYRWVNIIFLLLHLINLFLTIIIWSIALKSPLIKTSESFTALITYFLLVILLAQLVQSFDMSHISEIDIKRGELSIYLLKPFPYLIYEVILEIPWRLIQFVMSIPAAGLLWLIFKHDIVLNQTLLIAAFVLVPLCYLLSFLIQVFFATLTFWLEDTHGISSLLEILTLLFSGLGIPIFFFPPILKTISAILPFQYTLYFPVSLALNRLQLIPAIQSLMMLGLWLVILLTINSWLWKKGLRKYTGEGI